MKLKFLSAVSSAFFLLFSSFQLPVKAERYMDLMFKRSEELCKDEENSLRLMMNESYCRGFYYGAIVGGLTYSCLWIESSKNSSSTVDADYCEDQGKEFLSLKIPYETLTIDEIIEKFSEYLLDD